MRFVSTPEVLERFINLEKEILQTESSLQSNELDIVSVAGQGEQGIVQISVIFQWHHFLLNSCSTRYSPETVSLPSLF